jgi:hypothetical protein
MKAWLESFVGPLTFGKFGILLGYVFGLAACGVCFRIAWILDDRPLNTLIVLSACIAGWTAGMLLSPDPNEQPLFSGIGKAISTFLSGFLLAKLDMLFQGAMAKDAIQSLFISRMLLFATPFLICLQFTYVGRQYMKRAEAKQGSNAPVSAPGASGGA